MKYFVLFILLTQVSLCRGQTGEISGVVVDQQGKPLSFASLALQGSKQGATTDLKGRFLISEVPGGDYVLLVSYLGLRSLNLKLTLIKGQEIKLNIELESNANTMDEIVVTGTMKEVQRLDSPVPVEVYNRSFFKKNPTPNMYEALQNVNGVRPQLNCQVCNTGDIHINGLEGPYTMVLIDGMPIVSALATVYGLSGIPSSLIERMEVVKGPASSLYGSEAIGGLINIITKRPENASLLSADIMTTSWQEFNADVGLKLKLSDWGSVLTGVNYFNFDELFDNNDDNFTDVTIQKRVSVFQKWNFTRKDNRLFSIAGRYYSESRWGGELDWNQSYRGGNEVYGEAISTQRWEAIGQYALPTTQNLLLSLSFNDHQQNSVYGETPFIADQKIAFGQLIWDKSVGNHDLLLGSTLRYTYYDDNTVATGGAEGNPANSPNRTWLPGIFVQDELDVWSQHKLLLGLRYDYSSDHGSIVTPRLAYKWPINTKNVVRLNAGTGFRVVNLFTEEHAALTGARDVIIKEDLDPEKSYNLNLNYIRKAYFDNGAAASLEISSWYTYFTNVIFPNYDTNPNEIIYSNLDGFAVTKGASLNLDLDLSNGLSFLVGASIMDVFQESNGMRDQQLLTERFTATWAISYALPSCKASFDYTGNVYSPMRLPLLGDLDPRPEESPWWTIQNIQMTYKGFRNIEIYGGIKNLVDWTPWKNQDEPIIARSFDPFDRDVEFDVNNNIVATPNNPYALSFDPTYVYAPNQGRRLFLGLRYNLK